MRRIEQGCVRLPETFTYPSRGSLTRARDASTCKRQAREGDLASRTLALVKSSADLEISTTTKMSTERSGLHSRSSSDPPWPTAIRRNDGTGLGNAEDLEQAAERAALEGFRQAASREKDAGVDLIPDKSAS